MLHIPHWRRESMTKGHLLIGTKGPGLYKVLHKQAEPIPSSLYMWWKALATCHHCHNIFANSLKATTTSTVVELERFRAKHQIYLLL